MRKNRKFFTIVSALVLGLGLYKIIAVRKKNRSKKSALRRLRIMSRESRNLNEL